MKLSEDAEGADALPGVKELREGEGAGRSEGKGAIEEGWIDARRGLLEDFCDFRLANAVPVFEGRVRVSFEEIDGAEEVVGVGVAGSKPEATAQMLGGAGIVLLLEGNAAAFDGKARIVGRETLTRFEGSICLVETAEVCERRSVKEIVVGCSRGEGLDALDYFLPLMGGG